MIHKKYGQAFKSLRLQHRFTLRDFERIGLSKSTLSYFENGKTLISFDKLDRALHEMHTTFRAYSLMINDGEEDYWLTQFKQIELAYFSSDSVTLDQIYQKNIKYKTEETYMIALSAKACHVHLSPDEVTDVEEKLKSYQFWHSYEMYILISTLDEINPDLLYQTIENILDQDNRYLLEVSDYRNLLVRLVVRTILSMIRRGQKEYSRHLIERIDELTTVFDTYTRISKVFVKGCWIYKFEDKKQGRRFVNRSLKILSDIEAFKLKQVFIKHFNRIIDNKK